MNTPILQRLREEGRSLVDDEFLRGERAHLGKLAVEPYLEEAENPLELDEFDHIIDRAIAKFDAFDAAIDAASAPAIHAILPLSRREASDPGIWRYLAVVHRPDFVRHRWSFATRATTLPRFWQFGTRPNSNAFARLWWIAELTVDEHTDSYDRTRVALSRQALATNVFVRSFSHHKPAVAACLDVLEDAPADVIEKTLQRLTTVLTTIVVEGRTQDELTQLVAQIRDSVESAAG